MKKTLFMGALALTIATSMVAGTMAVYTHADTLAGATNDTVSAKKFYINSTATDKINIKLAPGNEEFWDFQVTNHKEHIVTEVPMDLKLKVDLKNAAALPDLVCTLYRVDGDKDVALASGTRADGSTTIELEKLGEFAPNVEKDSTYKLGFYWKDTAGSNDALDSCCLKTEKNNVTKAVASPFRLFNNLLRVLSSSLNPFSNSPQKMQIMTGYKD